MYGGTLLLYPFASSKNVTYRSIADDFWSERRHNEDNSHSDHHQGHLKLLRVAMLPVLRPGPDIRVDSCRQICHAQSSTGHKMCDNGKWVDRSVVV